MPTTRWPTTTLSATHQRVSNDHHLVQARLVGIARSGKAREVLVHPIDRFRPPSTSPRRHHVRYSRDTVHHATGDPDRVRTDPVVARKRPPADFGDPQDRLIMLAALAEDVLKLVLIAPDRP
jgi:hypothetical protein